MGPRSDENPTTMLLKDLLLCDSIRPSLKSYASTLPNRWPSSPA